MLYFIITLLVISPIVSHLVSVLLNKKISMVFLIFIYLTPLSLINNIIIPYKNTDFDIFQIFIFLIFFAIIFISIIYIIFNIWKYRNIKRAYMKGMLSSIIISMCLLSVVIFSLLISVKIDYDSVFSINISSNFINSIYSSEDYVGSNYNLIPAYTTAAYAFTLPALMPNNIMEIYTILFPLLSITIFSGILKKIIDEHIKSNKVIFTLLLMFVLLFIHFINILRFQYFWEPLFAVVIIILLNIKKLKIDRIYLYTIGFGFFSSTGYLLSLPLIICIILFLLLSKKWKESISLSPILLYMFALNAYISFIGNNVFYTLTIVGSIFFAIIAFVFRFFYKRDSWIYDFKEYQISSTRKLCFTILIFMIIAAFPFIVMSIWKEAFSIFSIIMYAIFISFLLFFYFNAQKTNNTFLSNLILFLFAITLIASCEYTIIKLIDPGNTLIFRVGMLMTGIANTFSPGPNVYICLLTIIYLFTVNNDQYFKISTMRFNFIQLSGKFLKLKYFNVAVAALSLASVSSITGYYAYQNIAFPYNLSRTFNFSLLNSKDASFLSSLNFHNFQKTYISDFAIEPYLNHSIDLTTFMNYNINNDFFYRSQVWQFAGFVEGIMTWNDIFREANNVIKIENGIVNTAAKILTNTIDLINDNKLNYYNYKTETKFNSVDFIFMYKYNSNSNYYKNVEDYYTSHINPNYTYNNVYESSNLLCLQKMV